MGDVTMVHTVQAKDHAQAGRLNKRCRSLPLFNTAHPQHKSAALSDLHITVRKQQQVILLQQQQLRDVESRNQVLLKLVSALSKKLSSTTDIPQDPKSSHANRSPSGSEACGVSGWGRSAYHSTPISKTKQVNENCTAAHGATERNSKKRKATANAQLSIARAAAAVAIWVKAAKAAAAAVPAVAGTQVSLPTPTVKITESYPSLSEEEVQQILQNELMQQLLINPPRINPDASDSHTLLHCAATIPDSATVHPLSTSVPAGSGLLTCQSTDVLQHTESQVYASLDQQQHMMIQPGLRLEGQQCSFQDQQWMYVADCSSGTLPAVTHTDHSLHAPISYAVNSSIGNAAQQKQSPLSPFNPLDVSITAAPELQTTATAAGGINNISSIADDGGFDDLLEFAAIGDSLDVLIGCYRMFRG